MCIRHSERLAGAVASIGTVGDSYDNAQAESLIGLYKLECVRPEGPWRGVDDLELGTLNWVHWFNEHRLHSALGYVPTGRVRAAVLPSDQPRAAAAVGRTRPSLNRGRFNPGE
jgi:putative transposase